MRHGGIDKREIGVEEKGGGKNGEEKKKKGPETRSSKSATNKILEPAQDGVML